MEGLAHVWQLSNLVVVAGEVHVSRPSEVTVADDVTVEIELETIVAHVTHIGVVTCETEGWCEWEPREHVLGDVGIVLKCT